MNHSDLDPRFQEVMKIHAANTKKNYRSAQLSLHTDDSLCTKLAQIDPDKIDGKWKCTCGEQFPDSFRAANHMEVVVMRVQVRKDLARIKAA